MAKRHERRFVCDPLSKVFEAVSVHVDRLLKTSC